MSEPPQAQSPTSSAEPPGPPVRSCAGLLLGRATLIAGLLIGAGLKIIYDLLLFLAFRHHRPPEERGL